LPIIANDKALKVPSSNQPISPMHHIAFQSGKANKRQEKLAPGVTDGRLPLSGFQSVVTLTLDRIIRHTIVHQSSVS